MRYLLLILSIFIFGCSPDACYETVPIDKSSEVWSCVTSPRMNFYQTDLDSVAKSIVCEKMMMGTKEVLLASYIGDNGSFFPEIAFVLWKDGDEEKMKKILAPKHDSIITFPEVNFKWNSLEKIFQKYSLDTVLTYPKQEFVISHCIGYKVEYFKTDFDYRERLQDCEWKNSQDSLHPKFLFWKELDNLLDARANRHSKTKLPSSEG